VLNTLLPIQIVALKDILAFVLAFGFALYFGFTTLLPQQFFGIAFWLGFTMHLIAAEAWINHTRADQARPVL